MFGEKTLASSTITGTSAYTLDAAVGAFKTWRSQFADLSSVFYCAENADGTIWEIGYGTLTYGSPDSISRTLLASSTGSLITWVAADAPIYVFSAPVSTALKHLLSPLAEARPAWLPRAGAWWDYATGIGVRWIHKMWTAAADFELGRYEAVPGIYVASPRNYWIDKGAANYTITTNDIGKVFEFDIGAGSRTATLPSGATVSHGFRIGVYGYGSATNEVVLDPNGSDAIDDGSGGANGSTIGQQLVWIAWDGVKWRTDYFAGVAPVTRGGTGVSSQPKFSAYQSGAQSIPNAAYTKVSLQTEEFDTASAFDSATNYRFTPLVAGYYLFSGAADINSGASFTSALAVAKNGSVVKEGSFIEGVRPVVSAILYMNGSTDYVEMHVAQNSGGSLNLSASATKTYFQGSFLST